MRRPVIKHIFKWSKSIGVERSIDHAKPGKGEVMLKDELTVIGIGSEFSKFFHAGDSIRIMVEAGQEKIEDQIVDKVVDDTTLILKSPGAQIH